VAGSGSIAVSEAYRYDSSVYLPECNHRTFMVTDENGTSSWDPFYPKDKLFEAKHLVEETKAQKVKGYDAYQRERERVLSQLDAETNKTMSVSLSPYLPPSLSS
jgi:hypothetical protein